MVVEVALSDYLMEFMGSLYCYLNVGGELSRGDDGTFVYKGGTCDDIYIQQDMTFEEYVGRACNKMSVDIEGAAFSYTLLFDEMAQ